MIAVVADVHLANHRRMAGPDRVNGLNSRAREIINVLERMLGKATTEYPVRDLVFAGDTLDCSRPEPQVIAALQEVLAGWIRQNPYNKVYILKGNHECRSLAAGDHALGPLVALEGVQVCDGPVATSGFMPGEGMILLPFQPGSPDAWLPGVLKSLRMSPGWKHKVLVGHFGVYDDTFPPWAKESEGAIHVKKLQAIMAPYGIGTALLGDWHSRRGWTNDHQTVLQVGALVPTGWDNPGADGYGTLALWAEGLLSMEEIPGPRFVTVPFTPRDPRWTRDVYNTGHTMYFQVKASQAQAAEARAWMERMNLRGEVVPTPENLKERVATVSAPATVSEALDEWLKANSANPPFVDREAILRNCRRYLGCV